MKSSSFIITTLAIQACAIFASCEDEAEYAAPTIDHIEITPNPCHEGDSVTATVVYANEGKYWYFSEYSFTINGKKHTSTKPQYGALDKQATYKFVAPQAGTYTIQFQSTVSPTAGQGNPFVTGPSKSAILTVEE